MAERKTYTVLEAATLLGVNHKGVYDAISENTLPSIKIGRRILIPRVALDRMLEAGIPATPSAEAEQPAATARQASSKQFKLQVKDSLHARVKKAAAANGRSLNAEIVDRVERSFLMDDVAAWLDANFGARRGATDDADTAPSPPGAIPPLHERGD